MVDQFFLIEFEGSIFLDLLAILISNEHLKRAVTVGDILLLKSIRFTDTLCYLNPKILPVFRRPYTEITDDSKKYPM